MKKPGGSGGPAKQSPAKGTAKTPPWAPVPVAVQRHQHQQAVKKWKPVPVAVQRAAHRKTVAAKAKAKAHKKPRQLSPGSDVACCTAEAVGTLLGWDRDQVLDLYWRTASDPDSGATILDTLLAAGYSRPVPHAAPHDTGSALILGVELPGPHAIAVTPDGTWWSWGEPFNARDWPELIIEEAWCLP